MYSRKSFDQRRAAARRIQQRESLVLAVVSVGLGVAQLFFLEWTESRYAPVVYKSIAGGIFLAYLALVLFLIVRLVRRTKAALPQCPHCSVVLEGMSGRVASATGKCDRCGGAVIE